MRNVKGTSLRGEAEKIRKYTYEKKLIKAKIQ